MKKEMVTIEKDILISLIGKAESLINQRIYLDKEIADVVQLNKMNSKKANELDDIATRVKKFIKGSK